MKKQDAVPEIPYDAQIDCILDYFDFEAVHRMMKLVGWQWVEQPYEVAKHGSKPPMYIPDIPALREAARHHLREVAKGGDDFHSGSGGLAAYNVEGRLKLVFEFAQWDTFDMEVAEAAA